MIKYMQSKVLNLPVKHDTNTGIVTVKDLKLFGSRGYVTYNKDEVVVLNELGGITPGIHLVKNIFDGTVVKEDKRWER